MRLAPAVLTLALAACAGALTPSAPSRGPAASRAAALSVQTPMQADAFVDSLGVNVHLENYQAAGDASAVISRMQELGLRHVREGVLLLSPRQYAYERAFFAQTHAKIEALIDCPRPLGYWPGSNTPPGVVYYYNHQIGGAIELLEGPNEPDIRGVKDWGPLTVKCIEMDDRVYATPFVAPAMAYGFDAPQLGSIASLVGIGAIHRYFSGNSPGNDGFWKRNGCGIFGQIAWSICEARVNSGPDKPIFVTETGWTTPSEIDEATQGKYVVRVLLYDSISGIARTLLYDFIDDGTDRKNSEDGYGLLHYDGSPKPSFYGVRTLVRALEDPGPAFSPAPLALGIEGARTIDHELFQKRDGTYVLAIWNEVPSWNPATFREIAVRPVLATIVFGRPPLDVKAELLTLGGLPSAQPVRAGARRVTLNVYDRVTLLTFE
ncbi:MAG TPA: hypothetical protein VMH02_09115 [Verrucomicrobiae bacterium]|nr:hypothetical protein [Verrucomicrobiae bacterium]